VDKVECRVGFSSRPEPDNLVKYGHRIGENDMSKPGDPKNGFKLSHRDNSQDHRRRPVRCSLGVHVIGASYPQACPTHVATTLSGITTRVAGKVPRHNRRVLNRFRSFTARWIRENLTPLEPTTDTSFESWINCTHYNERRKNDLRNTFNNWSLGGRSLYSVAYTRVKCFIKDEANDKFKTPRGIYSRTDTFKVVVGPIFKAIEHVLFENKYFIKHVPVNLRPGYIKERFGDVVGSPPVDDPETTGRDFIDAKRDVVARSRTTSCGLHIPTPKNNGRGTHLRPGGLMDSSVNRCSEYSNATRKWRIMSTDYSGFEKYFTPQVLEACEFQLYEYMVSNLPEGRDFMQLIRKVIAGKNHCTFKYLIAEIPAGRMSGEMNTSLGNGFTNLMIFLFLNEELGNTDVDCLIEGDDCLGVWHGKPITERMYEDIGFAMKEVKYLESCNLASFCGQVFDFDTLTVIMDPIKVILNFGWSNIQYRGSSRRTKMRLARAKALSLLSQCPACPILESFGHWILRVTHGLSLKIDKLMSNWEREHFTLNSSLKFGGLKKINSESRELMEKVFKVTIDHQIILEDYFNEKMDYSPISHPVIYDYVTESQRLYDMNYVMPDGGDSILSNFQRVGAAKVLQS
jgi:hypothetical protein